MTRKRRPQRHAIAPYVQHGEAPETSPQLAAALLEIVDTQLRDGTPPQTRQTFDRLVAAGYTPEAARQLLAHVVVREIFTVMARVLLQGAVAAGRATSEPLAAWLFATAHQRGNTAADRASSAPPGGCCRFPLR